MALTEEQIATFSTDIETNTDPVIVQALAEGNNNAIRDWYNGQASPDFYLWRTSMAVAEIREQHLNWEEVVTSLTTNGLLSLLVLTQQESVDPSRESIRGAFAAIFSGPNLAATRTALLAAATRLASYAQRLFAEGEGTPGSPALAAVEVVTIDDVRAAVHLFQSVPKLIAVPSSDKDADGVPYPVDKDGKLLPVGVR